MNEPKDQTIVLPGIPSEETFGAGVVTIMMSHGDTMYALARCFAERALHEDPSVKMPIAAVIMAATALEAYAGERLELEKVSGSVNASGAEAVLEDRGKGPEDRWKHLFGLVTPEHVAGRRPFQTFSLLVDLRNVLVHAGPRFRSPGALPEQLPAALQREFGFSGDATMGWESRVLNGACAKWACNTAVALVGDYWRLLGKQWDKPWNRIP